MSDILEVVRHSALLASCSGTEIDDVMRRSSEVVLAPDELLFSEDDRVEAVWMVLEGELIVTRLVDGAEVMVDHLQPGAYLGEISLLTATRAQHRARGRGAVRLLRIPGDAFHDLLRSCDQVLTSVLRTLAERVRRAEQLLQRRERMAGLGTIAAGLAHEIKNPASAVHRASELLREQFASVELLGRRLASHPWTSEEVRLLERLEGATRDADRSASRDLDALARSDREEALVAWLDAHQVEHGWGLAPVLVDAGVEPAQLDGLTRGCETSVMVDAFAWTERMASIRQLLDEIAQSTSRIYEMVRAVKAYSYVDTTTIRAADVHEALEHSLTILGHKLREAKVTVAREYDRSLPAMEMYGTELTHMWTNLLDNAADALAGSPGGERTIRVRTSRDGDTAVVEIADTGPGIAQVDSARIFDPFFTTKDAGQGTGLGLEIVRRIVLHHQGSIEVTSVPGATRFTVRLPMRQAGAPGAGAAARARLESAPGGAMPPAGTAP